MKAHVDDDDDEPRDLHLLSCGIWWTHNSGCTCQPSTAERLDALLPEEEAS